MEHQASVGTKDSVSVLSQEVPGPLQVSSTRGKQSTQLRMDTTVRQ